MGIVEFVVIVAFSLLILFIGLSFSKKSGGDMRSFFAAGGAVPWWIKSLSLFMGFASAGTFVVWGAAEMVMGVLVPVSIIVFFEIWLRLKNSPATEFDNYQRYLSVKTATELGAPDTTIVSQDENNFGKRMIGIGILVTGTIIAILGIMASSGQEYVIGTALILLAIGLMILLKTLKNK